MIKKRSAEAKPSDHPSKHAKLGSSILRDLAEAIHNAISLIDSEDLGDDEIIRDSEAIMDDLQDLCAMISAARATAFGRKGNLVKAMEEASRAIDAKPDSPRGYLVASELHSAQGCPKLAIQVLEDGLRSVLPSDMATLYDK